MMEVTATKWLPVAITSNIDGLNVNGTILIKKSRYKHSGTYTCIGTRSNGMSFATHSDVYVGGK